MTARVIPVWSIQTESKDITAVLQSCMHQLRLVDRSGSQSDSLQLDIADDGRLPLPDMGKTLQVSLGYADSKMRKRQTFHVDQLAHEGPPGYLTFSATTMEFNTKAKAPRERSLGDLTLGALIGTLARTHGYESAFTPAELAQIQLRDVDQSGQSDLALAWEVCRNHDAVCKVVDGKLWVRSYADLGEPVATLRPSDVTRHRAHFVVRDAYQSVRAYWHDYAGAKRMPLDVGDGDPRLVLDRTFKTREDARWHARSALGRARRGARTLTLDLPGRPDLVSQSVIRLAGFRDRVDDDWLIKDIEHIIDKSGYRSRIACEGAS